MPYSYCATPTFHLPHLALPHRMPYTKRVCGVHRIYLIRCVSPEEVSNCAGSLQHECVDRHENPGDKMSFVRWHDLSQ